MHGVNLGGWLSQCDNTKERYDTFITKKDFETIKSWGLDHVRIPVDYMLVETEDGQYKEEGFAYIQKAIDWCKELGLNMTFEEFKQFMSVEQELRYRCIFQILYYCGLRRGELRGLSWDNIDFFNKELSVVKNVAQEGSTGEYIITTPKTRTSTRTLPVPERVMNDLHEFMFVKHKFHRFLCTCICVLKT